MSLLSTNRRNMMAIAASALTFPSIRAYGEEVVPSLTAALRHTQNARGMSLPNVGILDSNGHPAPLSRWTGGSFLLHLWATWCIPCIRELPEIDAILALGERSFLPIVPVACRSGDAGKVRAFYEKNRLHHLPVYTDEKGTLDQEFQKNAGLSAAYPSTFLVEPGLRIRSLYQDTIHWTPEGLRDLTKAL